MRYLVNSLREAFKLPGTPIRLFLRGQSAKNPYKAKRETHVTKLAKHVKAKRKAKAKG